MSAIIKALYSVIGEYGVTIALFVVLMQAIVFPFDILADKNEKARRRADPQIKKIRKKYGVNAMGGFDPDHAHELAPEICAMSDTDKEAHMSREMEAVYQETGYKPLAGAIPGILRIALIILLYIGIQAACPEGIYKISVQMPEAGLYHKIVTIVVMFWAIWFDGFLPFAKVIKKTPENNLKRALIAPAISGLISIALTVTIAYKAILATTLGMLVLHVTQSISDLIKRVMRTRVRKEDNGHQENQDSQGTE